jgi:hypothetical protein
MSATDLKTEADGLFRAKKFVDAIEKYTEALAVAADDAANAPMYSNRAACREKLVASSHGAAKRALIAQGLADGKACVALAPGFARGYQRLATFLLLAIADAADAAFDNDDYVEPDYSRRRDDPESDDDSSARGFSAKADAAAHGLRRELEGACRSGLAVDPSNEALLEALQGLRDEAAAGSARARASARGGSHVFVLNAELAPTDADLSSAAGAAERAARHKAAGAKAFGAKDWRAAETAYASALACDPLSAASSGEPLGAATAVLYSNRSAARVR